MRIYKKYRIDREMLDIEHLKIKTLHIGAKCPFIFRWGFGKPLLRIQGFTENKKCSPEKVSI